MLTLRFSAQDLARTRFGHSPLWEVVTSVEALKDPGGKPLHLGWARETRAALPAADLSLLFALVPIPTTYVPSFLTPVPRTGSPALEDELAALAATPAETVRADLDRFPVALPAPVAALYRDPGDGLARLADQIRAYWEAAIEPHWSRIQRLVEGEVMYRARSIARGGAAELFEALHPQVGWSDDTLRVRHRSYRATRTLDGGRGLVLVPTVFVWPGVFSQSTPPRQPGLVYPPRGIATLWESGPDRTPDALAAVLGRSRARLLAELGSPASTTELAARTAMPAPTVSHHLTTLRAAGLAVSHRTGRSVLYLRTPLGEALLSGGPT
ncbi:DUF5937 family protein [Kitasatospora sp. NPDC002040]|uniref:ArsR/SmtB family transcription factor n=1 Tax=Kitasatospora sp. NPDC002040 TaxID=3154661 RepID=UPI0033324530